MAREDLSKRLNKDKLPAHRRKQIIMLERHMRKVRNEMDFLEILTNFWPINNMEERVRKLEERMTTLNHNYAQLGNPFQSSGQFGTAS